MVVVINSNLMARWANVADPERQITLTSLSILRGQGEIVKSTPQNYIEFWAVATRPTMANGLGVSSEQANRLVSRLRGLFPLLPDRKEVFEQWLKLVISERVAGKQVHDARLVAVMLAHGVSQIITFNPTDFTRYAQHGIVTIHPSAV